jgi:hypothetical protein
MSGFLRGMDVAKANTLASVILGVNDATDHLLAVSRDEAPLKTGALRMTAGKGVTVEGDAVIGEVFYSVTEQSADGERFNYALRVHEMGEYKNPTTPGTRPKFLSRPLKVNSRRYRAMIADAIKGAG